MRVKAQVIDDIVVVGLEGRLTVGTDTQLLHRLVGQLARRLGTNLILDLENVTRIDCAGIGQLGYVVSTASGTITLKSAFTTVLDSSSRIIWIRERFAALHTLSSDTTKIITSAANGTLPWVSLRSEYKFRGEEGWLELDPTLHHDQQLDGKSAIFQDIFSPRDTLKNPGS